MVLQDRLPLILMQPKIALPMLVHGQTLTTHTPLLTISTDYLAGGRGAKGYRNSDYLL